MPLFQELSALALLMFQAGRFLEGGRGSSWSCGIFYSQPASTCQMLVTTKNVSWRYPVCPEVNHCSSLLVAGGGPAGGSECTQIATISWKGLKLSCLVC